MTLITKRSRPKNNAAFFKQIVAESLVENYNFDIVTARKIIEKSTFARMLKKEPRFTYHYNAEYWAEEINKESKYLLRS